MEQSDFNRRNRHSKKGWEHKKNGNGKKQKSQNSQGEQIQGGFSAKQTKAFQGHPRVNKEISDNLLLSIAENDKAIKEFRKSKSVCAHCGETIDNIAESLCDKQTGGPIHFDCVISLLSAQEKISPSERIIYIGKGRFAVALYPSRHDDRNFSIRRIIEWEDTTASPGMGWRQEISGLFSQVK